MCGNCAAVETCEANVCVGTGADDAGPGGGTNGDAGADPGGDDGGGCCDTASRSPLAASWLAALVLLVLRRRPRR